MRASAKGQSLNGAYKRFVYLLRAKSAVHRFSHKLLAGIGCINKGPVLKYETMKPEELESEIMKLSPEARAALAEKIILSLEEPSDSENVRLWVAEAERRLNEMRQGAVAEILAEEVFRRAKSAIS